VWLQGTSRLDDTTDALTIERGLTGFGGVGGSASNVRFPSPGEDGDDGLFIPELVQP
jgi:hypothetical protein